MAKLNIINRYGVTPNKVLHNKALSLKAKGLFGYIQSKPDGWNFSADRIALECTDGRDSVRMGLIELEEAGYLVRTLSSNGHKAFSHEYTLYLTPISTTTEFPTPINPSIDKERDTKKEIQNNTTITQPPKGELLEDGLLFEEQPNKPEPITKPTKEKVPKKEKLDLPYSFDEELTKLITSDQMRYKIVGAYWSRKQMNLPTRSAFLNQLRRDLKAVSEYAIADYPSESVTAAFNFCIEKYEEKWTLETVGKRISENYNA